MSGAFVLLPLMIWERGIRLIAVCGRCIISLNPITVSSSSRRLHLARTARNSALNLWKACDSGEQRRTEANRLLLVKQITRVWQQIWDLISSIHLIWFFFSIISWKSMTQIKGTLNPFSIIPQVMLGVSWPGESRLWLSSHNELLAYII